MSPPPVPHPVRSPLVDVAIVAANTVTFDARQQRTASALAGDGHAVTLVGFAAPGLPAVERLEGGITLRRVVVDGSIASAFRPLPGPLRRGICRLLGIAPGAASLPPDAPKGLDRLRHPVRRVAEIAAHARRVGPWSDAVLAVSLRADVYHCKAFIAVPVIRRCARPVRRPLRLRHRRHPHRGREGWPACRAGSGPCSAAARRTGCAMLRPSPPSATTWPTRWSAASASGARWSRSIRRSRIARTR